MDTGNVTLQNGTQQPVVVPGLFPGGGMLTLQGSLNQNGGISLSSSGRTIGGGAGIDWKALAALATVLGATALAGLVSTPAGQKATQQVLGGVSSLLMGKKQSAPQLSAAEQQAVANHDAGLPYDRKAYNSAVQKINKGAKFNDQRNVGKDRGQPKK
jgi:hypothetical protein